MTPMRAILRQFSFAPRDSRPQSKLDSLQLLRAMAAGAVVLAHAAHEADGFSGAPALGAAWNLGFGVDIFFVISGFIMLYSSFDEFGRDGAPQRFFLRRWSRVAPLYWLLTTVLIVGSLAAPWLLKTPIGDVEHVVASYLFIPDPRGPGEVRPVMALGWTLEYEMMFYLLFSAALLLPARRGIAWLSCALALLVALGALAAPQDVRIAFWTRPIILEFLMGVFAALAFRAGLRLSAPAALALGAFGLLGFLRWQGDSSEVYAWRWLIGGAPAACLALAAALGPGISEGRLKSLGVAIGNASYGLYLIHPFVLRPLGLVWMKTVGLRLPPSCFLVFGCIVSVAAALLLYRFVERPLTDYLQRRIVVGRKRAQAALFAKRIAFAAQRLKRVQA
jgi:peptidoglycan/LPS O-acetylase OafA/YrhL